MITPETSSSNGRITVNAGVDTRTDTSLVTAENLRRRLKLPSPLDRGGLVLPIRLRPGVLAGETVVDDALDGSLRNLAL